MNKKKSFYMEDTKIMEIYFSDLKIEAQKELLRLANIETPEEANWDSIPIAEIPITEKG